MSDDWDEFIKEQGDFGPIIEEIVDLAGTSDAHTSVLIAAAELIFAARLLGDKKGI